MRHSSQFSLLPLTHHTVSLRPSLATNKSTALVPIRATADISTDPENFYLPIDRRADLSAGSPERQHVYTKPLELWTKSCSASDESSVTVTLGSALKFAPADIQFRVCFQPEPELAVQLVVNLPVRPAGEYFKSVLIRNDCCYFGFSQKLPTN